MKDDDAKKAILARRARFIAAAVLTAGIGARCDKEPPPQPCLTVAAPDPTPSVCLSPVPTVCLSVAWPQDPPDAGATINDAGASDAASPPRPCLSPPRPCLSQRPPDPPPQPCLSPKRRP